MVLIDFSCDELSPTTARVSPQTLMNVAIFNLRFGANLGDRLISKCLESELSTTAPWLSIQTFDLAGRDKLDLSQKRRLAFFILNRLPGWLRLKLAETLLRRLSRRVLAPKWRAALAGVDAVVIGGGGIFADNDLNFPIKIAAVLDAASAFKLPVAVIGVGVAHRWSERGQQILARSLSHIKLVALSVRDRPSADNWSTYLSASIAGDLEADVAPDPAFLSAKVYPKNAQLKDQDCVGLCITSPTALKYHDPSPVESTQIKAQYIALADELVDRGKHVKLFTTGVSEDIDFLQSLRNEKTKNPSRIEFCPIFHSPEAMVTMICTCGVIVAHRLHAIIPAFSFGIPGVAFTWDEKMQGQCELMGMQQRLHDLARTPPSRLADCIELANFEGIDPKLRDQLVAKTEIRISQLANQLTALLANA